MGFSGTPLQDQFSGFTNALNSKQNAEDLDTRKISGCGSRESSPGSIRRCLCIAVIPRAWIVGTEKNRADVGMGSKPHDKFTFSRSSVKERDSVTIFNLFFH